MIGDTSSLPALAIVNRLRGGPAARKRGGPAQRKACLASVARPRSRRGPRKSAGISFIEHIRATVRREKGGWSTPVRCTAAQQIRGEVTERAFLRTRASPRCGGTEPEYRSADGLSYVSYDGRLLSRG